MGRDGFWRRFGKRIFVSDKNICEHVIVCVKIVAECAHVLLGAVAIQNAQDRVFLFIHYIYLDKIDQKQET